MNAQEPTRDQTPDPTPAAPAFASEPEEIGAAAQQPPAEIASAGCEPSATVEAGCGCTSCAGEPSYVYALGTIEARFPSLAVEKEFVQAARQKKGSKLTDRQLLHRTLSEGANRYLAREMCWVLSVEGLDTYLLEPRSEQELEQLIAALEPESGLDLDVVIGTRGPLAPPQRCNGLQVPMVVCDRVYTFGVEAFIDAIPRPESLDEKGFANAARELFERLQQLTDNVGEQDEHRAINYLALRYPQIYSLVLEKYAEDKSLTGVQVQPSRLSHSRRIVQVIFRFVDRQTDVEEKYFVRVDVSEKWPFLVSKLQPFYDR